MRTAGVSVSGGDSSNEYRPYELQRKLNNLHILVGLIRLRLGSCHSAGSSPGTRLLRKLRKERTLTDYRASAPYIYINLPLSSNSDAVSPLLLIDLC